MSAVDVDVDEAWGAVFGALERLRDAWPAQGWSYDRRLRCVVSSIPMTSAPAALAAIAQAIPGAWTAESLPSAPPGVRTTAEACGGLRESQQIFADGAAELGAFGLWWPWGDGTTVSLRIGLWGLDQPKVRYPRLRDVFGIPQAPAPGAPGAG